MESRQETSKDYENYVEQSTRGFSMPIGIPSDLLFLSLSSRSKTVFSYFLKLVSILNFTLWLCRKHAQLKNVFSFKWHHLHINADHRCMHDCRYILIKSSPHRSRKYRWENLQRQDASLRLLSAEPYCRLLCLWKLTVVLPH